MKHFRARYFLHSHRKVPEQLRMPNAFAKKGQAHKRHVFRRGQSRKDGFSWTRRSKVRYPNFRTNHVGQVGTERLAENSESRSLRIYSSARNARCPTAFRLWKTASASLHRSIPPYNSHRHRLRIREAFIPAGPLPIRYRKRTEYIESLIKVKLSNYINAYLRAAASFVYNGVHPPFKTYDLDWSCSTYCKITINFCRAGRETKRNYEREKKKTITFGGWNESRAPFVRVPTRNIINKARFLNKQQWANDCLR